MKAVCAVLSLMLAASLAWADFDRGVRVYDRCEIERMDYQAPNPGIERCPDGVQFGSSTDPSLYSDYYLPRVDPDILRPARYVPGSPDRDDNSALPNIEPEAPKRHNEFQIQLESGPVPASVDPGWPPPKQAVARTAESDHFWPPSARILPPLEFDGSSDPDRNLAKEIPPLEFDGGQPNPKAEWPRAVAW